MVALDNRYRSQGLVVVGVSREDAATQRRFAQKKGASYPLLIESGKMPEPYSKVTGIPTTFIIDRRGVIRDVLVGYEKGALESKVTALLNEQ